MGPATAPLSIQSLPKTANIANGTPSSKHLKSSERVIGIPISKSSSQENQSIQFTLIDDKYPEQPKSPSHTLSDAGASTEDSREINSPEKLSAFQMGKDSTSLVIKDHDYLEKRPELDKIKKEASRSPTSNLGQDMQSPTKNQPASGER